MFFYSNLNDHMMTDGSGPNPATPDVKEKKV